jgi:hypothetical protein
MRKSFKMYNLHIFDGRYRDTNPRVVTGENYSPTVAHACRKRRLKWVLAQVGSWSTGLATLSL